MFLFSLCARLSTVPPIVRYTSVIQIKSFYSKNRLTVTTDPNGPTFGAPAIYSTRPPFDDGWLWSINQADGSMDRAREAVLCGDNISLSSPITGQYVATRSNGNSIEVFPTEKRRGGFEWTLICRNPPNWTRDEQVQFRNVDNGCFLSTSLYSRMKEGINLYNVSCSGLSEAAVWRAVEGVYFAAPAPPEQFEGSDL
jgi:hypothetical protein